MTFKYKGFTGFVTHDREANLYHGEVLGMADVITFQATSESDVEAAFRDSVDDYLRFVKETT